RTFIANLKFRPLTSGSIGDGCLDGVPVALLISRPSCWQKGNSRSSFLLQQRARFRAVSTSSTGSLVYVEIHLGSDVLQILLSSVGIAIGKRDCSNGAIVFRRENQSVGSFAVCLHRHSQQFFHV